MLDLKKEEFVYNGWVFEFLCNPSNDWMFDVFAKKGNLVVALYVNVPMPPEYRLHTCSIVEQETIRENAIRSAFEDFKKWVINEPFVEE